MRRDGKQKQALAYKEKHPELVMYKIVNATRIRLGEINKRLDKIVTSRISESKKRKEIEKYDRLRLSLVRKINKRIQGMD